MNSLKLLSVLIVFFCLTSFDCNKKISKGKLIASGGVYAIMPPDFEYDFKYRVISYEWIYKGRNDTYSWKSKGSLYLKQLKSLIKEAKKGDMVFIEKVKVIGDDDLVRKISGLSYVIR